MPGLLSYAAAGLAQGIGAGMEESGRQQYEMMRDELRAKRASEEAEKNRRFQQSEREAGQVYRTEEREDQQEFTKGQNKASRDQQREMQTERIGADRDRADTAAGRYSDTFTGGDGYLYERPAGGGTARKVVDKDGNPIMAPASKSPDSLTASERAKIILQAQKDNTHTNELNGKTEFDEEGYRRALRAVGIEPVGAASPKAAGEGAPPPAPRDPAQRKVGQVYVAPDGRKVEWVGQGWRLVE